MSTKCIVNFDNNPNEVFTSGQLITGNVEIITSKPKVIKGIHIGGIGIGEVRWVADDKKQYNKNTDHMFERMFESTEQYLSAKNYVVGHEYGQPFELLPGTYIHNFQIQLFPDIPTSFRGNFGHILYEIVVTIERHNKYNNTFVHPFTVINPVDLNYSPANAKPITATLLKEFCCGWCQNMRQVVIDVTIPLSGYAPGQFIEPEISVNNDSSFDIEGIDLVFKQRIWYSASVPYSDNKHETVCLFQKELGRSIKHTKKLFHESIEIPSTCPSTMGKSKIINVDYMLYLYIRTSGCHMNSKMEIPITIGAIPLNASIYKGQNVVAFQPRNVQQQNENGTSSSTPHPYSPIAPSCYEEASQTVAFTNKVVSNPFIMHIPFIPKYPIYHVPNNTCAGRASRGSTFAMQPAVIVNQVSRHPFSVVPTEDVGHHNGVPKHPRVPADLFPD